MVFFFFHSIVSFPIPIPIPSAADFSAGTKEDWRTDAGDFPEEALGAPLDDWAGEVWVDVSNEVRTCGWLAMPLLLRCDPFHPPALQYLLSFFPVSARRIKIEANAPMPS